LFAALGLALSAAVASAQSTGSSFGGGSWGSSSSSSSSSWGSSSSSSGSSWGGGGSYSPSSSSSSWGSSSSGGGAYSGGSHYRSTSSGSGGPILFVAAGMVLVFAWIMFSAIRDKHRSTVDDGPYFAGGATRGWWNEVDITALRLAVDWRARPLVQRQLEALARSGKTQTPEGRRELLQATARLLGNVRLAWMYADVVNHQPMSQASAQGIFQQIALDARARFSKELVRAHDGAVLEGDAGELSAKSREGPGVVLVTVVVAARRELTDVGREQNAHEVFDLLAELDALTADQLVAFEVIWSPAAEDDRMSTAELEALYPEVSRLDEVTVGGRVFCEYCGGPYPDELRACAHCGAPNPNPAHADA